MLARIATCGCLAVALLLTSSAAASAALFEGGADGDPKVSVAFERRGGKILDFTIERARFFCTDGDRFRAGTSFGSMQVRKRSDGRRFFRGHFRSETGTQEGTVRGRLGSSERARGTVRLIAMFKRVGCYTRLIEWTAVRGAS